MEDGWWWWGLPLGFAYIVNHLMTDEKTPNEFADLQVTQRCMVVSLYETEDSGSFFRRMRCPFGGSNVQPRFVTRMLTRLLNTGDERRIPVISLERDRISPTCWISCLYFAERSLAIFVFALTLCLPHGTMRSFKSVTKAVLSFWSSLLAVSTTIISWWCLF